MAHVCFPASRRYAAHLLTFATMALASAGLLAQSTSQAPAGSSTPAGADQYTGVAHPPADDSIVANEDPAPAPAAKPLPGVPLTATAPGARPGSKPDAMTIAPLDNPDYGIVGGTGAAARAETQPAASSNAALNTLPSTTPSTTQPGSGAHLIARPTDPDYGIVGMVSSPSSQLAEGTNIHVRLLQNLSTTRSQDGEPFRAQVASDVYKEGRVVIPVGSELKGRVVGVSQGHRMGPHATIRLRPDSVILPDGTAYHVYAQAVSSSAPGTKTDDEGGIQTKTHVAKDLIEYGTGAGSGAIVGAVLGGPVGAGAGALGGAGAVTTHLLSHKPTQAELEQGTEVVFSLTEAMDLLPTRN